METPSGRLPRDEDPIPLPPLEPGPATPRAGEEAEGEDAHVSSGAGSAPAEAEDFGGRRRNSFVEALALVMTALLLALTLKTYVAEAYEIKGSSMLPTFQDGERVVVLKNFYEVERGDIIIFSSTEEPGKDLIKRVIGLPGERVTIRFGRVYIDGQPLEEDYVAEELDRSGLFGLIEETVEPGEYYVLGDNRGDSHDSRRFHGVPEESIKGKVVVRWWPLAQLRSF